jgi:phenylalanyl-tRNA synthetase beta chain
MKISLNWLGEFVNLPADPRELGAVLPSLGLGVESMASVGDDCVLDLEVTTNRPDCLSHYGVARELAAYYRTPLRPLRAEVHESGEPAASAVSIEIADPELCARYCGRVVKNVRIEPSPAWLAARLEAVGVRPINNVADVTNYVLMELGHPLHAFDFDRIAGRRIIVRRARAGEGLRTLDGVDRKLDPANLVIADETRPVALAGVMGGAASEISAGTRHVLLESAWFEPTSVRRTAKMHGLHTEASHRFERGADIEMAPVALNRAAALIAEIAGGEVLSGIVDVYRRPLVRRALTLRASEIHRLLGTDAAEGDVERILRSLGFAVQSETPGRWQVSPPSFRLDVSREVDLVEELARHLGYDRLPSRVRPAPPRLEHDELRTKELALFELLVALGYRQIIAPAMLDPAECTRFTDRPAVIISNPLSQEASAMRTTAVPSMLHALRWNLDRGQEDLRLFEVGKTYTRPARAGDLPEERRVLTLGLSGHRRPASVHDTVRALDFFDLKGDLEALFQVFDLEALEFKAGGCSYYDARLSGRYEHAAGLLVIFGQLGEGCAREYKLRRPVWLAEIDLESLLSRPLRTPRFRSFPRYPVVVRDFALVVPDSIAYQRIAAAIEQQQVPEIRSFRPVDLFRGGSLDHGCYGLLIRVYFQSEVKTLTNDEIDQFGRRILSALHPLGIRLRHQG